MRELLSDSILSRLIFDFKLIWNNFYFCYYCFLRERFDIYIIYYVYIGKLRSN